MIELIIAIALTAIISGGITMTIFQVFDGNTRSSNHMIAVKQVENAGYWVSHDGQMAQSVAPAPGATGFPLTLTWTEYGVDGDEYQVDYTLEDMTGSTLKNLQRVYSVNGTPTETGYVAEYINQADTSCGLTGGGTFTLPDKDDAFTITGDAVADSGKITVDTGSIKVTTNGSATYKAGTFTWTTPDANGTVVVTANEDITAGVWTSTTANAKVAITTDTDDENAIITGRVLTLTVTVTVGTQSETRTYEVVPRPGS